MATSRTGTAQWKTLRTQAIRKAKREGITNCPRCGILLDYTAGQRKRNSVEVDHITPHAQGGTDSPDNVQVICGHCNRTLGDKRQRKPKVTRPTPSLAPNTSREW